MKESTASLSIFPTVENIAQPCALRGQRTGATI
jgi:hypothetical protein